VYVCLSVCLSVCVCLKSSKSLAIIRNLSRSTRLLYLVSDGLDAFHVVRELSNSHLKDSTFTQRCLQLQLQSRYLRGHHRLILANRNHIAPCQRKKSHKLRSNQSIKTNFYSTILREQHNTNGQPYPASFFY